MNNTTYSFKVNELLVRLRRTRYTSPGKVTSPQHVRDLLTKLLKGLAREHLIVIALDAPHNVIGFEIVSQGTSDTALASPREILKSVLLTNASALVVAHNHPSGLCDPSPEDRHTANRLAKATHILDLHLLDFVIVTEAELYSFAQSEPEVLKPE